MRQVKMKYLSKELSTFCHTTSMKGVPRIAKSSKLFIKCIWIIAVIAFLGLALYQVVFLVSEYFKWHVVVQYRDELLDPYTEDILPRISLCNQQPIRGANQSNASDYYKYAYNITQCDEQCTNEEKALRVELQAQLLKPSGYFQ